jgi:FkbM family methyltransferase
MTSIRQQFRSLAGIARSCRIYYGDHARAQGMDRLYRRFVAPGDLVFDIGSHVGDRVASFRRLGARVVAVEPQPAAAGFLKLAYGWNRKVSVVQAAVGGSEGTLDLHINIDNPTISTGSQDFIAATRDAPGWQGQNWAARRMVPMVTLDRLIQRHGIPAFTKIDVEGFEAEVLAGLSTALTALSFEFTLIQRDVALLALARLEDLGRYRFNAALGESQSLEFAEDVDATAIKKWLRELPHQANSGDIYAVLNPRYAAA